MGKLEEAFRGFAVELLKKQEAREIRESFGISNEDVDRVRRLQDEYETARIEAEYKKRELEKYCEKFGGYEAYCSIVNQSEDAANNYLPSQKDIDNYLKSMGKKDKKEPEVACPECGKVAPISVDKCPACGADF